MGPENHGEAQGRQEAAATLMARSNPGNDQAWSGPRRTAWVPLGVGALPAGLGTRREHARAPLPGRRSARPGVSTARWVALRRLGDRTSRTVVGMLPRPNRPGVRTSTPGKTAEPNTHVAPAVGGRRVRLADRLRGVGPSHPQRRGAAGNVFRGRVFLSLTGFRAWLAGLAGLRGGARRCPCPWPAPVPGGPTPQQASPRNVSA